MPESEYLRIATKKIAELTTLAEQQSENSDKQIDISSSDKILRIAAQGLAIVINTQTPNRQLWYSCTASGPQRFDYAGPK